MRTDNNFDRLRIEEDPNALARLERTTKKLISLETGAYFRRNIHGQILIRTSTFNGHTIECYNPMGESVWLSSFTDVFPTGEKQLSMF